MALTGGEVKALVLLPVQTDDLLKNSLCLPGGFII